MLESLYQEYKDEGDGFLVIQFLGEDFNGGGVTVDDLQDWIDYIYDKIQPLHTTLTFIVAADSRFRISSKYNDTGGYIPFYWLIDQDRIIVKKNLNLNVFESKIQDLLGVD